MWRPWRTSRRSRFLDTLPLQIQLSAPAVAVTFFAAHVDVSEIVVSSTNSRTTTLKSHIVMEDTVSWDRQSHNGSP